MRTTARALLVVLGLLASLREAGSAACASTCAGHPLEFAAGATCAPVACSPEACCTPCGAEPVECPLLAPSPQALLERAPSAKALPSPVAFFVPGLPLDLPALDAAHDARRAGAPADHGVRPRAGPLWLRDLRLLI